jgi:hypothetical protein
MEGYEALVQPLFDGPIDIIADVHGEIDALRLLLNDLGYRDNGHHPQGRRLVFLGDLTDRGPNSPAVVRLLDRLLDDGLAQCILGNHELNLLRGEKKHGAAWFYGKANEDLDGSGRLVPQVPADQSTRELALQLFRKLPLALERDDIRIVHASWSNPAIERVRREFDVIPFVAREEIRIREELQRFESDQDVDRLLGEFGITLEDALTVFVCQDDQGNRLPRGPQTDDPRELLRRGLNDPIGKKLVWQNWDPVKVLTSGPERRVARPFYASGKWRQEGRMPWWEHYTDAPWCIFGHYWRIRLPNDQDQDFLFDADRPFALLGAGRCLCIDYSVGKRWRERPPFGPGEPFRTFLAALRWPERELVFNGQHVPLR